MFLVQAVLNHDWQALGSPGRRCLRRWALARALTGAGRGGDAASYASTSVQVESANFIFGSIA